ncbi:sensor histidine kinase [Lachnospiraceae bacterium KM106-2]|nr:sensor histidine kinase [Lachnospiraceae bacterium KM106-2]
MKFKDSIRFKFVSTLAVLILFTIFLCWFMNKTFFTGYYEKTKINTLGQMYEDTCDIFNDFMNSAEPLEEDKDSEKLEKLQREFEVNLERMSADKNVSLNVFTLVYTSLLGSPKIATFFPYEKMTDQQQKILYERTMKYFNSSIDGDPLVRTQRYSIYKVKDERTKSFYLELWGNTAENGKGSYVYLRSSFEAMKESVDISNKFLAYIGIVTTLIGMTIMFFISRSFTRPIMQLSNVAKSMTDLNFNVKYQGNSKDEVGVLGNSINILSEKLETTISELKSANNELQRDIENKIQIDEMRKEFLSNVTHELKTPIALIQGYAEGLQVNINDDQESRDFYCEVIMDEAAKMNNMVKKLLSLNHIESGTSIVEFERFDMVAVIKSVLDSTEILFQQKNVICDFKYEDPIYVWADEYMIEEVVTNYISNALNHVNYANIIEIKLIEMDGKLRVAVYNTGDLIPEEDIDKVWIKFFKVDKARTREYGGSGIGLSIVKAIMEAHNQRYGVQNRVNGVEFWFECDRKNE